MSEPPAGPRLVWERTSKFSFEAFEDITPSTKPWRIKNAWPMRGVVFIAGASGAAKTFFALDGVLKLAAGAEKVWGRRAQECGVLYVAAEDADGCRARVRAWKETKGKHRERAMPFKLVPQVVNLLEPADVEDFVAASALEAAAMAEAGTPLGLICFDTFSCCIPGVDENSSQDMSRALEALYQVARELDVLVVVVAHFGKSGTSGGIRGWSGLGYNADGVIVIERDEEDPELRHVSFQKVKNGPGGGRLDFRLDEVDLGMMDEAGDPMSSCIVKFQQTRPEPTSRRKPKPEDKPAAKLILRALGQLLDVGQTYIVPPVPGVPPNTSGVLRTALRERTFAIGYKTDDDKDASAKRNFNRDLLPLISAGVLREYEGVIWRVKT
jgi:hypothetical protein